MIKYGVVVLLYKKNKSQTVGYEEYQHKAQF